MNTPATSEPAEPSERDDTDEWRITPARTLTSVAELEQRIDVALATARTAEEAALEIGAASLEAAEQARRAAALAERASASAVRAADSAREASVRPIHSAPSALVRDLPTGTAAEPEEKVASAEPVALTPLDVTSPSPNGGTPDPFEDRITAFRLRAERVMLRLQKIELGAAAPSRSDDAASTRRGVVSSGL